MVNRNTQVRIDVLCVGHAAYDLVFQVPAHPGPDEKCVATNLIHCGGGPAANAAVAVTRLGLTSAFVGYLGKDVFGDLHLSELKEEGVVVDYIVRGSRLTPLSSIFVKPDGKRSVVNYRAPLDPLSKGQINFDTFKPKVVLFDGHEPDISLELVEIFKGSGVKTLLDAGSLHRGTERLMTQVDYLLCSERFVAQVSGGVNPETALDELAQHAPVVVVTQGERGLIWEAHGKRGSLPAYPVKVIDTTGAGDAFHGAFAACLALGKDLNYILRYSSAVAALNCTKLGGRPGLPTADEVALTVSSKGWELDIV